MMAFELTEEDLQRLINQYRLDIAVLNSRLNQSIPIYFIREQIEMLKEEGNEVASNNLEYLIEKYQSEKEE